MLLLHRGNSALDAIQELKNVCILLLDSILVANEARFGRCWQVNRVLRALLAVQHPHLALIPRKNRIAGVLKTSDEVEVLLSFG